MTESVDSPPRFAFPVWMVGAWALCIVALFPLFYAAKWAGSEVGRFQRTTFEQAAREALAKRDFASAIRYCDGAIKAVHERSDHWGRVFTLRSVAYLGQGDSEQSLAELLRAGDFFTRRYYYAEDRDRSEIPQVALAVASRLLEQGKPGRALEALSAGAMASGDPVEALHDYVRQIDGPSRQKLWGDAPPFIQVMQFIDAKENALLASVNEQGRSVGATVIEEDAQRGTVAQVELGASSGEGNFWLAAPTYVPLRSRPFAVRVRAKLNEPADFRLQLGYWFESPQKSATTQDTATATEQDGWVVFDVQRNFFAERQSDALQQGYAADGGAINQVALVLPPGTDNTLSVARAEIYLPATS